MKETVKSHHHNGSFAKLSAMLLLIALLMSMFAFAQAEQTEPTEDPFYPGLIEEDVRTKKPTATPMPTRKPMPTPTEYPFEPGLREEHEGHKIEYRILDSNDWRHTIKEYCSTCRMTIKDTYTEDH